MTSFFKRTIGRISEGISQPGFWFVFPAGLIVSSLLIYPIFYNIIISFSNKNLLSQSWEFIGWENYLYILADPAFYTALGVSLKWTAASIFLQLLVGFTLALMLNRVKKFQGFFRAALIIPWAFPGIIIALSWQWILNDIYGFLNNMLMNLNLISSPIYFLSDHKIVFITALCINVWFGAPLMMVNILSALQTVPAEQYEAIQIDGAGPLQAFYHITLRHIRTVIGLLLVLRTIWVFNNFEFLFLLTGGGPGTVTETLPMYAYKTGWMLQQLGRASAVTMLLLIILLAVCLVYFYFLDKWEKEDIYE